MLQGNGTELVHALIPYSVLLFVMAVVFYGNNTLLRLRWPQFFADAIDDNLLTASSYPGAITLGFACWAGFTGNWLAVAFAVAMLSVAVIGFLIRSGICKFSSLRSVSPPSGSASPSTPAGDQLRIR